MRSPSKIVNGLTIVAMAGLLSACAGYTPSLLPEKPDLALSLTPESVGGAPYPVNFNDGLDLTETAMIAVIRNPDLKAERAKRNIGQAEAFSAGLLPDPQLATNIDHPFAGPDTLNGLGGTLSFDFRSLLTHGAQADAAKAKSRGTDMEVLWQEWQVIQKVRTLYVQKYFAARKSDLLNNSVALYTAQEERSRRALAKGDITLEQASADLAALMDAQGQKRDLERTKLQTDNDLDALLGLVPGVDIPQQPLADPILPPDPAMQAALEVMPERRPDLLALQAAYQSREETLYKAVLEQFPSLSIGFSRARDTAGAQTVGLGVTLDLPLFNRNRGEIAVQKATREQLRLDYQARLDQAQSDVMTLWRQSRLIESQLRELQDQLPRLEGMAAKAEKSYKTGDFPALNYIALRGSLTAKKSEYLDLQQSLWSNRIALDTLLAWPEQNAKENGTNAPDKS